MYVFLYLIEFMNDSFTSAWLVSEDFICSGQCELFLPVCQTMFSAYSQSVSASVLMERVES